MKKVDNNCTCSHHRDEHEPNQHEEHGRFGKCKTDGCTCRRYTMYKFDDFTPVKIKYMLVIGIIIVSHIAIGAIGIGIYENNFEEEYGDVLLIDRHHVNNFNSIIEQRIEMDLKYENRTVSFEEMTAEVIDRNTVEPPIVSKIALHMMLLVSMCISFVLIYFLFQRERDEELKL